MKIVGIVGHAYRVPFRHAFSTSHGAMTTREGILVQVRTDGGITGIGEIAPLASFGGASLSDASTVFAELAEHLSRRTIDKALELLLAERGAGGWVIGKTETEQAALAQVRCGLEIALLDALGQARGRSISELLSPDGYKPRTAIAVNAVIGTNATGASVDAASLAIRSGFRCVKLKVGLGGSVQEEVERVAAVREAIGPGISLRLDANEAWGFEQAVAVLSRCVPYDIQYVEQPLKATDLDGMRALRRQVAIPIAADEAVSDPASARLLLEREAADILVIKVQQAGGLRAGQQIIQEATRRGCQSVITSSLETGVGVTAALHLAAASPAVTLECGLATLSMLADDLILDAPVLRNGMLVVPAGAGLGIAPDEDALKTYSLRDIR
jgi:o-succinylbenzoate synthase